MIKRYLVVIAIITISLVFTNVVVVPAKTYAQVAADCDGSASFLGFPTWYRYLEIGPRDGDRCAIIGPATTDGEIDWQAASGLIALALIEILLRVATIVALVFVLIGGFKFITSQGEPDNAASARQTIQNALIGLVISLLATGIVAFVASSITS